MKSSKRLMKGANAEDKRTEEILKWAKEVLNPADLDNGMIDSGMEAEEKCILRMQRICYEINNKFMNLDPAYIDEMGERIYLMLYEENEDNGAMAS